MDELRDFMIAFCCGANFILWIWSMSRRSLNRSIDELVDGLIAEKEALEQRVAELEGGEE